MIRLSREAEHQFVGLVQHFAARERLEARTALIRSLQDARSRIEAGLEQGLPAPRPYPDVARPGRAWIKSGRYWIGYSLTDPPVIVAIFHDTADIPSRL